MLFMGNLTAASATSISTGFAELFGSRTVLPRQKCPTKRIHQIPSSPNADSAIAYTRQLDDPDNTNSVVCTSWELQEFDIAQLAAFLVLDNIIAQPVFDTLRTKE